MNRRPLYDVWAWDHSRGSYVWERHVYLPHNGAGDRTLRVCPSGELCPRPTRTAEVPVPEPVEIAGTVEGNPT